jgi:hypothetical protein
MYSTNVAAIKIANIAVRSSFFCVVQMLPAIRISSVYGGVNADFFRITIANIKSGIVTDVTSNSTI